MLDLWLKFEGKKVPVTGEIFIVGRHSECDLSIVDGRLSRQHLKIERFGDVFAASDLNSSNGTKINGTKLQKPTTLRNGDVLDLGGLQINVEMSSGATANYDAFGDFDDDFADDAPAENEEIALPEESAPPAGNQPDAPKIPNAPPNAAPSETGSIPKALFFIAPVCAIIVVVMVVGALLFFGRKDTEITRTDGDFIYSHNRNDSTGNGDNNDDNSDSQKNPTPKPTTDSGKSETDNSSDISGNTFSPPDNLNSQSSKNQTDTTKIETSSASFLRKIAQNDPKAFLTSEQAQAISVKIKQFGNSSDLADNIKSARSNAAQIQALANSKNLKPQFIVAAALAKLGGSRGNVLQTAQAMADVLDKLSIQLGSELADDSLLTVAVYDQGAAGDFLKTRNMLQDLSNKFPDSSRTIRTIWFLHKNNKISDAEYDFALRFLAIGTITQNPKDFSVNAEELKLN